MFDIGAIAANRSLDHLTVFGMWADFPRQVQKHQRFIKRHLWNGPAFGNAGSGGLGDLFRGVTALHIRTKTPRAQ